MSDVSGMIANKEFLESLIAGDFKLPDNIDAYHLCLELLPILGSPDPVLRDDLSATVLDHFVSDPELINGEQAGQILSKSLDRNHLFMGIGEEGTDSVFMRSFSALLSSSILYRDSIDPSIDSELIRDGIDSLLRYSKKENDLRGYVKGKGWAHSVAHLSDALYASAGHPSALREQLIRILDTTSNLSRLDHPMSSGECERLAYASCKAIAGLEDPGAVLEWIAAYPVLEGGKDSPYAKYNSGNFLRSLYFDLKWEKSDVRFLDAIEAKSRELDPLYRMQKDQ